MTLDKKVRHKVFNTFIDRAREHRESRKGF